MRDIASETGLSRERVVAALDSLIEEKIIQARRFPNALPPYVHNVDVLLVEQLEPRKRKYED